MSWILSALYPKPLSHCKAELRPATNEEIRDQKPKSGWFAYPDWLISFIAAPIFISYRSLFDFLLRGSPDIASTSIPFVATLTKNPEVMKEILLQHRNDVDSEDGIFSHKKVLEAISDVMQSIYPSITPNDNIMTCDPIHTELYRKFLKKFFNPDAVRTHFHDIKNVIDVFSQKWKREEKLENLNIEMKLLASTVTSKIFLGYSESNEKLSLASTRIILWTAHNAVSKISLVYRMMSYYFPNKAFISSEAKIETLQAMRETVNKSIEMASRPNAQFSLVTEMMYEKFSPAQIQAMLITLFVAGQDNVSTSLTHILLKLAQDVDLQEKIATENSAPMESILIRSLICESLRMLCPVGGIGRTAAKDAVLTIRNAKTNQEISRQFIQKGEDVQSMLIFAAQDPSLFPDPQHFDYTRHKEQSKFLPHLTFLPFGYGTHLCPGWYLYYAIAALTVSHLVKNYRLSTSFKGEPKTVNKFVTQLDDKISITLQSRK